MKRAAHCITWTSAEDILLAEIYPNGSRATLLAALPGRTERAVRARAQGQGLHRASTWLAADTALIRAQYPVVGAIATARLLGRGVQAVHKKACALGLRAPQGPSDVHRTRHGIRTSTWASGEVSALRLLYPGARMPALLIALPGRSAVGIRAMASRLKIARPGSLLWTAADDALLRTQYATQGPAHLATLLGRSVKKVSSRAHVLGLRCRRIGVKPPVPKVRVVKAIAIKPVRVVTVRPVVEQPAKRAPGTPVLNQQKMLTARSKDARKLSVIYTTAEIKAMPLNDPIRRAHWMAGDRGVRAYLAGLQAA